MTPIETNKPLFFDTDGSPLEGGLIYIGQPSTDPRINPKTVTLRDSGGPEFTASQPLKTKAGHIVYNGLPIVALVDGEYSMLIINANGQQVDYSRSVNSTTDGGGGLADFSEVTRVGLTLDETKAFDVSVGEVVRNIGKTVATDELGEEWLVVSATGSPGDDETLIDFTNGLQGQVILNKPDYQEEVIELGGDFTAGESVKITRLGSQVTISSVTGALAHPSSFEPQSAAGAIPSWARVPSGFMLNVYGITTGPVNCFVSVDSSGTFQTVYRAGGFTSGTGSNRTNTAFAPSISYNI